MKAMAYQPEPLGISQMPETGFGGAGLCSPKMTPFGEWKSACWDSDYFDGSEDPERETPGPKQWFRALWERDFPLMKELGANTIRLYNVNPTTRLASEKFLESGWNNVSKPYGKDHIPFLDYAYESGLRVIFPLVSDESALTLDPEDLLIQKTKNLIDEVGDHPAVIMWAVGNELALEEPGKKPLLDTVNQMMNLARDYTKEKHDRILPVTHCVADLPESYRFLSENLEVDVFCSNAGYRSDSLTDLFTGDESRNIPGWDELIAKNKVPLLIGEFGWLSINNTANYEHPDWFNKVWKDILDHIDNGCIGGVYFEFSDEKYKMSGPDQTQLGVIALEPYEKDGLNTETDEDFFYADVAIRKEIIFDAVKEGTLNGAPMNFNMDIFKYLGRSPGKIKIDDGGGNTYPPPSFSAPGIAPPSSGARNALSLFMVGLVSVITLLI